MSAEEIRDFCLSLPAVTESIKWEDHLCFSVGEKMFFVLNPDKFPVSSSFKTNDDLFEELTAREGIIPAPYMAKYKWVLVDSLDRLAAKEWKKYIKQSYDLVFAKLSKKMKASIQLTNDH